MWPTTCEGPAAGGLRLHVAYHTTGGSRTVKIGLAIDAGPGSLWLLLKESELPSLFSSQSGNIKETWMQNITAKMERNFKRNKIDTNVMSVSPCDFLPQQIMFKGHYSFVEVSFVCMITADSLNPGHPIAVQQQVKV